MTLLQNQNDGLPLFRLAPRLHLPLLRRKGSSVLQAGCPIRHTEVAGRAPRSSTPFRYRIPVLPRYRRLKVHPRCLIQLEKVVCLLFCATLSGCVTVPVVAKTSTGEKFLARVLNH